MRYTFADLVAAAQAIDAVERMKAELAEFAAQHLPAEGLADFIDTLDIASGDAFDVAPAKAIDYFKRKGLRASYSYADMIGEANDAAFTVAKMMDVDLLGQVRQSLDAAIASGTSFGQWKREIAPILKAAGWWGESEMPDPLTGEAKRVQLGSAWRLETIFRTNMQTAYAAGQWKEIQEQADLAPFLMYDAVDDFRTRPLHAAWDGTVLPVKSAWWKTHYPPNGWNCRCGVIQMDADQLREMGLTPRADPPDDGTFTWTNPRTGEVMRVPNGIDPGFNRNAGAKFSDELRDLLDEKVQTLPPSMQKAIAAATRREFDTSTRAGRWHKASFDQAPDWLRNKVLAEQAVQVETESKKGAFARGGVMVDMDGKGIDNANGQSVWRHEFGHILDARGGGTVRYLYRSEGADFREAQEADANALKVAAGAGRKSKANDAKRAAVVQAYEGAAQRIVDAERTTRPDVLREMATAAGLDFDAFVQVVRDSTLILDGGIDLQQVGAAVRVARMIEAVRLGDGEGFLRWASYKDEVERAAREVGQYAEMKQWIKTSGDSWRKDGALSALSDLFGSASRNKVASYHNSFPGHSDSYYKQAPYMPTTESFANLASMAGHPNAYWWEITKRFAPAMVELFRQIIEGNT